MINFLLIVSGAGIAGFLYYLGGETGHNTKVRDWGVPIVFLSVMGALHIWHWSLLPCAVLMWFALSAYHKYLNPLFNKSKADAYWFNWMAHGLGIALAISPYAYFTHKWMGFFLYTLIIPIIITILSEKIDKVFWEAGSRGFFIVLGLAFFMI